MGVPETQTVGVSLCTLLSSSRYSLARPHLEVSGSCRSRSYSAPTEMNPCQPEHLAVPALLRAALDPVSCSVHDLLEPEPSSASIRMYNKMWHQTQEALNSLLDKESQHMTEPQRNQVFIFQTLATFYIKYVQIFRNLENIYDQIVHPQKRILIRKILDGVMGRILELKNEMVELELTEFHYFDDILQDLKLAPQQLDIPIPKYFLKEKLEAIRGREKILAQILAEGGLDVPNGKTTVKAMPLEEAVKLIQVAERARQGRLRAIFMKQIYLQEYRAKQARILGEQVADAGAAALRIQKVWRGFHQCKKTEREREEEMVFLGMTLCSRAEGSLILQLRRWRWQEVAPAGLHLSLPLASVASEGDNLSTQTSCSSESCRHSATYVQVYSDRNPPPHFDEVSPTMKQAERVGHLRSETQMKHEERYREALVAIKSDLQLIEGPDIKESLQDQIRHWFIECRNLTGTFPNYPDAEDGGSAVIFSNKTPEQVIDDILTNQDDEEKNKKKKKEKRKTKKEKEKKGTKEKTKEEDEVWKMSPSVFLQSLQEGNNLYKDMWMNKDESWNFLQEYDPELIKQEKRKELESEIRIQVDELMRQELKNLKLAVNKEKELPVKEGRKKGKKKGKKTKKGKRGKKDKDLTADRTIESLYKELVEEGLLIQSLKVNLSDYIGEYSYLGTTLRHMSLEPMPSLLDVRQLITLYGILPLGSAAVHEKAPLVKSLLLAGPSGVGKKMLVHAICTETGANLFNLSAANIAGKYPGKSGLQMMLHVVFKVARQFQPSVVWIEDTEKTFYKKVPNAEKLNEPKRLKKQLPKILKLLQPNDRILIVGTTQRPFDAELQSFCKVYEKIILVPRPDYASRYVLWKQIIQRKGGVLTKALNISCLAKVTDGFTQGHIVEVIKDVLTERRIWQQARKPLTAGEFITAITSMSPVYKEEEDCFKDWYAKTPLGKKQALSLTIGGKEKEKAKGKKKGKKEKKRKAQNGAIHSSVAPSSTTQQPPAPGPSQAGALGTQANEAKQMQDEAHEGQAGSQWLPQSQEEECGQVAHAESRRIRSEYRARVSLYQEAGDLQVDVPSGRPKAGEKTRAPLKGRSPHPFVGLDVPGWGWERAHDRLGFLLHCGLVRRLKAALICTEVTPANTTIELDKEGWTKELWAQLTLAPC
ncbi:IQ and AAA domain-containing protein 1 [Fukomys damarensis]|uniref:IQ and AAA domain-containing protein 1 n=1 Tax=Fukomys damarensis TaxID=885580 RepID=A0A091DJZ8_FUKDA|nr:IQ and AAA domain-containing protein 1 [Fukomys damarensis]